MAVHGLQGGNAAFSAFLAAAPAKNVQVKQNSSTSSFEQLVNNNLKTDKTEVVKNDKPVQKEDVSVQDKMENTEKMQANEATEVDETAMETAKKVLEAAEEAGKVSNGETDPLSDELLPEELVNVLEGIMALLTEVKQTVMDALGLTEEQFQTTLDEIGVTLQDLLNKDVLQQFYLQANGADVADFITSENLLNNFMDLTKTIEQLMQNAELIPEMEQLLAEGNVEQMLEEVKQSFALNETKQPDVKVDNTETDTEQAVTEIKDTVQVEVVKVSEESAEGETELNENSLTDGAAQNKASEEPTLGEKFLENLTMSTQTAATGETAMAEEALTSVAQMREIVDQIVEKIKVVIQPEQTNMELQLNPEHLGRVHLTITEKEGMMTAQFAAETHAAKEAIESQLVQLKEALQEQGLKVESIEVMVSDFAFSQNSQAGQSTAEGDSQKRRAFVFDTEEDTETKTSLFNTPDYLVQGTSSVEYSA